MILTPFQIFEGAYPDETTFVKMTNGHRMKPHGGLWTCNYVGAPDYSAWFRWCVDNDFRGPMFNAWLLKPASIDRVLIIDTLETWNNLPIRNTPDAELPPFLYYIDYEQLAHEYDGIHLTERFIYAHRLDFLNAAKFALTIDSWDVSSTLWFRWCFESVQSLGEVYLDDTV